MREIAHQHKSVILVDEEKQMPQSGIYFSDPCHFTQEGIAKFVEHALHAMHGDIERWKASQHLVVTAEK
jgi:hypothetical protein